MMNRMGFGGGGFAEYYKCHPIGKLSAAKQPYEYSGKIILPTSALAKLAALHIEYPMLFQLQDEQTGKTTHAGVIEFVAPEGHVYMPTWVSKFHSNSNHLLKCACACVRVRIILDYGNPTM
jgi:ubiquitin fusion degradation protein 1